MKGKITVVLFSLVLVFGMLAASCDNGAFPDKDDKDADTYFAYYNAGDDLPVADIADEPTLLKGKAVYDTLQLKTEHPAGSMSFVSTYVLGKVAIKADYDTDQKAIATKYAGMQIIVTNPVLLSTP